MDIRYDFMMGKVDKYVWMDIGSSFVPSEVSCAILFAQLERANHIETNRLAHFSAYQSGLAALEKRGVLKRCVVPEGCHSNAHIFFILLPNAVIRKHYEEKLKLRGISAFTHYVPLHSAPAGLKYGRTSTEGGSLPVTDQVFNTLLRLPVWSDMTGIIWNLSSLNIEIYIYYI